LPSVGKDIPHDSAHGHATGRSIFIDDMPPAKNELFVGVVGSPIAHGRIVSVDLSAMLKIDDVVIALTSNDIPGHNRFGPIIKDEHLLVEEIAEFLGDPVVLIGAQSRESLHLAKKAVRMHVEPMPPVFTIDEAIALDQFIGPKRTIARGDADAALADSEHVLDGTLEIGGQEHFYLESQAARAVPGEDGSVAIESSTQHPTETQSLVAEILGVPFNRITVTCKRMGGGFGGKETQAAQPAAMAALVATKTNRPSRVIYNKDDDMCFTGKRHPWKSWYKVGFDSDGRITALCIDHYSNGGCSADLSPSVLERGMLHTDNAYFLPHVRITGRVCKTNLPSNTAFRGFGGPQGVANIENIIELIASHLGKDALEIRKINLYSTGDRNVTPYGQIVRNNVLPRLVDELAASCDYEKRRAAIEQFNAASTSELRGFSLTLVKFGISFTKKTLNQANALVNIYTDGSVTVTTGATEMGQGVHTRVRQITADELGIPYESVTVGTTSTEKNHNTSPTAASSGTDLNGAAAADACAKLRGRLADFAATIFADAQRGFAYSPSDVVFENGFVWDRRSPEHRMTFPQLVCRAYLERINLGERGFYITPGVDFNRETGKGHPFFYFTNGAACSEVSIDRFTGETRVVRVDLLMDAGMPINPGIDRGQIVGGFIQGMGWVTTEELRYSETGELLSHSPTTYKIPSVGDLPPVFNVAFLDNPDSTMSIRRSKALGEPPLLLGISVWTAVRNAIASVSGGKPFELSIPATNEQVLMKLTALQEEPAVSPVTGI
jgi:xanthine dehydrogenase large subunit